MMELLETIREMASAVLIICAFFHYRRMRKTKRERRLSAGEAVLYAVTQAALYLVGASIVLTALTNG